jgi:hypothetical protein
MPLSSRPQPFAGETSNTAPRAPRRKKIWPEAAPLTRLAALGTLSRGAGEGLERTQPKLLSRTAGTAGKGGTKPEGLGG